MNALRRSIAYLVATLVTTVGGTVHAAYWSLFNFEGENQAAAVYVTYATLADMLVDQNRTGSFVPDGFGAGRNVVGSGSSGSTYWSLFNFEGENQAAAVYVTYATLADMLVDQNRTGSFVPDGFGAGRNVVDSGSDVVPSASVFEPGTIALLGVGLAGLAATRRRKQ